MHVHILITHYVFFKVNLFIYFILHDFVLVDFDIWLSFSSMDCRFIYKENIYYIYKKKKNVMYCQVWWPILEIGALHLTHPSAHTAVSSEHTHTHTHTEHAPRAVGSHCSSARGAIGGSVPCSRAPQSWYCRWRECCSFTIPTFNSCRCENRTSDLQVTSPTL